MLRVSQRDRRRKRTFGDRLLLRGFQGAFQRWLRPDTLQGAIFCLLFAFVLVFVFFFSLLLFFPFFLLITKNLKKTTTTTTT